MKTLDLLRPNYNYYPYVRKKLFPIVVQVGVGGTGSNLAQQVAQMLSLFKGNSYYVLADADIIEKKNLQNQLYVESNVGKSKAEVLAKRYSAAYNLSIAAYDKGFVEDIETLKSLFSIDFREYGGYREEMRILPILIGCVDNNYTRKLFHKFFHSVPTILYIDSGNDSAVVPKDYPRRPKEQWSKDEWNAYNESGWTGQVVAGLRINHRTILEPVADRFPDILEDDDEIKKSEMSCEELNSSDPQRLLTNRMAAMAVCTYLSELFECGTLSNSMTVFHAKKGYMRSEPVADDVEI